MILTPDYVVMMARYNAWQNKSMKAALAPLSEAELNEDRGAFFGSILATINHILWGDQIWLHRLAGYETPGGGIPDSTTMQPTFATWGAERFRVDGVLLDWAGKIKAVDLTGEMTFFSGAKQADVSLPVAQAVTHVFNHQTHHRGQVHAMLTAAGQTNGYTTDLAFMPKEGPWL